MQEWTLAKLRQHMLRNMAVQLMQMQMQMRIYRRVQTPALRRLWSKSAVDAAVPVAAAAPAVDPHVRQRRRARIAILRQRGRLRACEQVMRARLSFGCARGQRLGR